MKYISFILLIFLCACQQQSAGDNSVFGKKFFDVAAYFESEINQKSNIQSIQKITVVDGDTAKVKLEAVNFAKELKLFSESNINKVSWLDRYQVDTISISSSENKVEYTALDENLQTRKISIQFRSEVPQKIEIHNRLGSMIMDTDQYLTYEPTIGYSIKIQQVGKLQDSHDIYTEARFRK